MEKKMMVGSAMLLGLALAIMVLASPSAEPQPPAEPATAREPAPPSDDITCQQAITDLMPCQPFLISKAGARNPSFACCLGAQNVFQQANTTQNRRDLCECLKKAAAQLGVKTERAKQIAPFCKIALTVPIDPNVDCST